MALIEFIIFKIFDASQRSILSSSLYIMKCQEQTSSIIQNINTGIITREKQMNSQENIQFCNRFAMQMMGEDGHWEEFKNQDGDIISPDNLISKDRLIDLIRQRKFFEYNQDKVASRSSSHDLAFSISDFFKMSPRRLIDGVFYFI
uniref:Uncharacterized protein n=1 Tax=Strombidium inclinatum TaxID=197538 RepID=A0A7S3N1E5_9SPIT|mmetsp:Transcript_9866/g.14925  ORF Transcript_9866/g.14925 Transcript_9866/m.14925 type:complete len:146 (+) Transcript_9866:1001-1438(+)